MTLIQTLFSNDFVIQVSDRRLTKSGGGVFDDDYTKLICWNQSFTAGFTGLARIDDAGKKSTAEWIAEVLSDYPVFEMGVEALRHEAEERIKKLPKLRTDKRLAVVIAGFDQRGVPLVAQVANFNPLTGVSLDQTVFTANRVTMLTGRSTGSHSVGALLNQMQQTVLRRYVPRILAQPNGINRAIRIMVENQRLVAGQNPFVGTDSQCVFIPREPTHPGLLMSNLDGIDIPTHSCGFVYFESGGFQYKQVGPLVAHGGQVIDQLTGTADPANPDNQSVSIRILKVPSPPPGTNAGQPG
jgi:hypothetical protein